MTFFLLNFLNYQVYYSGIIEIAMQMKKQLSMLLVRLVYSMVSFPANSLAIENDLGPENNSVILVSDCQHELYYLIEDDVNQSISVLEDNPVSPFGFYVYKDKTIPVDYTNFNDIKENYPYEEFSRGYWWRGTLFYLSSVKTSKGYTVTYSGKKARWVE